mmetsp:Transcript_16812/g.46339  ORF Transcript_16812/g.46339 Transcript_16812/m.46339 type:complete len:392 (-) Transcript_16812:2209-3384(-)
MDDLRFKVVGNCWNLHSRSLLRLLLLLLQLLSIAQTTTDFLLRPLIHRHTLAPLHILLCSHSIRRNVRLSADCCCYCCCGCRCWKLCTSCCSRRHRLSQRILMRSKRMGVLCCCIPLLHLHPLNFALNWYTPFHHSSHWLRRYACDPLSMLHLLPFLPLDIRTPPLPTPPFLPLRPLASLPIHQSLHSTCTTTSSCCRLHFYAHDTALSYCCTTNQGAQGTRRQSVVPFLRQRTLTSSPPPAPPSPCFATTCLMLSLLFFLSCLCFVLLIGISLTLCVLRFSCHDTRSLCGCRLCCPQLCCGAGCCSGCRLFSAQLSRGGSTPTARAMHTQAPSSRSASATSTRPACPPRSDCESCSGGCLLGSCLLRGLQLLACGYDLAQRLLLLQHLLG